jgi:hypothetical protein
MGERRRLAGSSQVMLAMADNLFTRMAAEFGAYGAFDSKARDAGRVLDPGRARTALAIAGAAALGLGLWMLASVRNRKASTWAGAALTNPSRGLPIRMIA